jgi:hypothetical protein
MFHQNPVKIGLLVLVLALLVVVPLTAAFAAQPGKSCEDTPTTPGMSASAPGSAFNPNGIAGTVYAGEQPQNSKNPKSVSQYDVACFELSQH